MQKRTLAAGVAALVVAAAACSSEPEPTGSVLEQTMTLSEVAEFQFVPEQSGPYQVLVQFDYPITDQQIETLVDSAAASTGAPGAPTFDFAWSVLRDGTTVGRREAPQRHTGVVDTHASGLGAGPRVSRGLAFGGCTLESGRTYTLRVEPGAALRQIASAHPRIKVVYRPNALGLSQ